MSKEEKIIAYLENEMSVEERQHFEHAIENDPELKSELEFQNEIIEGLKSARVSELKAIMDNVPVGGTIGVGSTITFGKFASGIAVIGILSLATYYFMLDGDGANLLEPKANNSTELLDMEQPLETDSETLQKEEPQEEEQDKVVEVVEDEKSKAIDVPEESIVSSNEPEINRPSAAPLFETSESDSLEAPTNDIVDTFEGNLTSLDVEIDNTKKKYSFHYQFNKGKLFLFGDFDKELYEILEFKTKSDKTLFLYYEGHFYPLNKNQVKIVELKPVKEKTLIDKLKNAIDLK